MGLIVPGIAYGFGRPSYYLTDHQFQEFMKYSYGEWLQVRPISQLFRYSACWEVD